MRLFSYFCEALKGLEFKFQCSRSAFVIFRDFQIGIVPMKQMEGRIKSGSGVLQSYFPSIILFCLGLDFILHLIRENEVVFLGWELYRVFLWLSMEDGGLGSGPYRLLNPSLSLPRKLLLLFILTCPIEANVLWKIQEGPLRGKEIYSPADKVVLREFWAWFFCVQHYFLFGKTICPWYKWL